MTEILERNFYQEALDWGKNHYPNSPNEHHQAFASIIVFACKIPVIRAHVKNTMRTYVAINILLLNGQPGQFDFDKAIVYVEKCCYGPVNSDHADVYKQCRFGGEYQGDIIAAELILNQREIISLD